MLKSVQLRLSTLKYGGDSIGRDVRVEIEMLGKFLRVDKRIKAGTTVEINREVGNFETDQKLFEVDLQIVVMEKDLLFNDIGNINGNVKIDTNVTKPQQFIFEVPVKENRSILGKFRGEKTANFEIILEANITDAVRYVSEGKNGWLTVKIENHTPLVSLPVYLKVKPGHIDNRREYFTILEGAYRNKRASVKIENGGSYNFISGVQREPEARASYSISQKIFTLNGRVYKTVDYKNAPWKKGLYDIEIPDHPHPGGSRYEKQAPRAKTWFRIGHSGERYLHTGGRSLGCITVIETVRWAEIYNVLIKARKSDFMSVGVLEIVD